MGKIKLKDIKIYAYHGCLSEENLIGGEYLVNLSVFSNLKKSSLSDELKDTIDYVSLLDIVKKEMPESLCKYVAIEDGTKSVYKWAIYDLEKRALGYLQIDFVSKKKNLSNGSNKR